MPAIAPNQGRDLRFASVNATTASGDNLIVTGIAARKIRVVAFVLTSLNANTIAFKTSSGAALSGAMPVGANGGVSFAGPASSPCMETVAGDNLVLTLGAGVGGVQGFVAYVVEPA